MGNSDDIDTMIKTEKEEVQEYTIEIKQNTQDTYNESCLICGREFSNELDMINHQFLHTNDDFTYDEVFINESFKFEIKYLDDPLNPEVEMNVDELLAEASNDLDLIEQPEPVVELPLKFKCGRCPRIFRTTDELTEHSKIHFHKCKKCNYRFPELKDLQEHMTKTHKAPNPSTTAKCNQCNEMFTSVQELLVHSLTHSKLSPKSSRKELKCVECNREFQKPSQLRNHMFIHLPDTERPYKCDSCDKSFATTSILKKHKLIHLPKAHQCLECGKFFSRPTHLRDHSFIHKPESEKPYECDECKKRFGTATELKSHSYVHKSPEERPHKCSQCDRCYTKASSLREHIQKNHDLFSFGNQRIKAEPSNKKIVKLEVNVGGQKIMVPERTIISPPKVQQESFSMLQMVENQIKAIAKSPRRYFCEICNRGFSRSDHLKRHSLTHLPLDKRPFKCWICNRSFDAVEELRDHSLQHTPDPRKPFVCEICGKPFTTKTHLYQHASYHKVGIPRGSIKCEETGCEKAFDTNDGLKKHASSHVEKVKPTVVSKFQCAECKVQFTTQALLDNHRVIHDPLSDCKTYKCSLCDKMFGKAQNLRKHQLVHSNEYPFECPECLKKFKEKKSLTRHQLIHSDIRDYKCTLCPREFHRKDYLKNHMLTHKK